MLIHVEFAAPHDPVPVAVAFGRRRLAVHSVMDRWHGPGQTWWKLDTDDGPCILLHDEARREWTLVAVPNACGTTAPAVPRSPRGACH